MAEAEKLLMIVDPETKEALRRGDGPQNSGPLFFTSREAVDAFTAAEGMSRYEVYEVPSGVLTRMRGKPHWVDGKRG